LESVVQKGKISPPTGSDFSFQTALNVQSSRTGLSMDSLPQTKHVSTMATNLSTVFQNQSVFVGVIADNDTTLAQTTPLQGCTVELTCSKPCF
jgi:hypothetical protein